VHNVVDGDDDCAYGGEEERDLSVRADSSYGSGGFDDGSWELGVAEVAELADINGDSLAMWLDANGNPPCCSGQQFTRRSGNSKVQNLQITAMTIMIITHLVRRHNVAGVTTVTHNNVSAVASQ